MKKNQAKNMPAIELGILSDKEQVLKKNSTMCSFIDLFIWILHWNLHFSIFLK